MNELTVAEQQQPEFRQDPPRSRLVVVESVYYQCFSEAAVGTETRFDRPIESTEEVWRRKMTAGPSWRPVDCGWFKGKPVSHMVVQNRGRVPVEVSFSSGPEWRIGPGQSMRGQPADPSKLLLRAAEPCECIVTLYPE